MIDAKKAAAKSNQALNHKYTLILELFPELLEYISDTADEGRFRIEFGVEVAFDIAHGYTISRHPKVKLDDLIAALGRIGFRATAPNSHKEPRGGPIKIQTLHIGWGSNA